MSFILALKTNLSAGCKSFVRKALNVNQNIQCHISWYIANFFFFGHKRQRNIFLFIFIIIYDIKINQ